MNHSTFLATLAFYLAKYFPEELDTSTKPIDSAECIPCRDIEFDFIIVGAGSSGCILASRLTENPSWKVLLIEAGGDDDYVTDTPILYIPGQKYQWNFTTVPQKHTCKGGRCPCPVGRVMGGCSTVNGMEYVRGNRADYDIWESMGNPGWSYDDVLPYFLKPENITIPELLDSPYHSTGGPLSVGYGRLNNTFLTDIMHGSMEYGLPITDYNGANQYGSGYNQVTVKGPIRCSTTKAYLEPNRDRPNLYIFKNTMVTKILFSEEDKSKAIGVSCVTDGEEYNVYSCKEVIVSAGSVNSPKILQLSGVGPRELLEELEIPVYADLPVGENFMDHSGSVLNYYVDHETVNYNDYRAIQEIIRYAKDREGILTYPPTVLQIFISSPYNELDIQFIVGLNVNNLGTIWYPGIYIYICNVKPQARGSVKIKSKDYKDKPLIDPNYFGAAGDYEPVKWGTLEAFKLMETPSIAKYSPKLIEEFSADCNYSNPLKDTDLDCIIRSNNYAGLHLCCSNKMGPASDKTTVVDHNLIVHGMRNLRVIDSSVMPLIPTANTNAPTIMIAEKGADIIKAYYGFTD